MCSIELLGICFVQAKDTSSSIFGFSSFISALAIFFIVYSTTGERYKFRIAIAPFPLYKTTFFLIPLIGVGVLISELWPALGLLNPDFNLSKNIWQAIFASLFLLNIMLWAYFGFINPPKFSNRNHKKFMNEIYSRILKGNTEILKEIESP